MARKKIIQRVYNFSDTILNRKASTIVLVIQRHMSEFSTRGVDDDTITAFEQMKDDFFDAPYDDELLGDLMISTESKNELAENLRVAIRTIRSMVQNKWGTKHANYRIYSFEDLNQTPDETLHRLARAVLMVVPTQLAQLASEGLTQVMIDNLKTIDDNFDVAIDQQRAAVRQRDIGRQERIEKGNALYKELFRLCNIGKDLFATVSEAIYNDFIIYNTKSGKNETDTEE